MRFLLLILCLIVFDARAAKIQDIEIIDFAIEDQNEFQFKVRSKQSPPNAFFFLVFDKGDRKNLEKMNYILLKLVKHGQYRVDLDIPSFSPFPSGSYYRSADIQFFGQVARAPNQTDAPKAKKK